MNHSEPATVSHGSRSRRLTRRNELEEVAPLPLPLAPRERPGSRERAASPWLSAPSGPSETFRIFQSAERQLVPWGLWPSIAVAPATALGAGLDWAVHLASSPAKQLELAHFALEQSLLAWKAAADGVAVHPLPQDKRFADPAWQLPPYRQLAQRFLLQEQW